MGELEVRGPWIASGYYQAPEHTGKWSPDGWFRTGDVATIGPEGYAEITDRTKDLVKSGGEGISSMDLEHALMGHPRRRWLRQSGDLGGVIPELRLSSQRRTAR